MSQWVILDIGVRRPAPAHVRSEPDSDSSCAWQRRRNGAITRIRKTSNEMPKMLKTLSPTSAEPTRMMTMLSANLTAVHPAVILVLNQYKRSVCSPGKHPDTRTKVTVLDDGSPDNVHGRCLCIAV